MHRLKPARLFLACSILLSLTASLSIHAQAASTTPPALQAGREDSGTAAAALPPASTEPAGPVTASGPAGNQVAAETGGTGQTDGQWQPVALLRNLGRLIFNPDILGRILNVILTILVGVVFISLAIAILKRIAHKRLDPRSSDLLIKIIQYTGFALIVINAFKAAKVDLSPLLGAAGIVGIALGFAAQTSVANFISGFFLVSEKAFTVGDILTIDNLTGVVFSIDTLSIKLRAFDNRLIRIPNETLIKANMINLTRFPVRRLNIVLTVPFDTDIDQAKSILLDIATRHPTVLLNPEPFFMVQGFSKEGIDLFIGVWFTQVDWEPTNNGMYFAIKKRFDEAGIHFAYPTYNLQHRAPVAEPELAGFAAVQASPPKQS